MKNTSKTRIAKFIYRFSIVGASALGGFGIVHLLVHDQPKGLFELTLAFIVVANLLWFRLKLNYALAITVAMVVMFAIMPFLLVTGGLDDTGIIWIFLFPPVAFFLSGKQWGTINTALFFVVLIGLSLAQVLGFVNTPYTLSFLRQCLAALLANSLILYFYESINEEDQQVIFERNQALEKANRQLAEEADARAKSAEKLARQTSDLEQLNQLMIGRELKMVELKKQIQELKPKEPS